ncbi:hypothetical protein SeMB42_g08004, partial [Synchytrium endobioticum]
AGYFHGYNGQTDPGYGVGSSRGHDMGPLPDYGYDVGSSHGHDMGPLPGYGYDVGSSHGVHNEPPVFHGAMAGSFTIAASAVPNLERYIPEAERVAPPPDLLADVRGRPDGDILQYFYMLPYREDLEDALIAAQLTWTEENSDPVDCEELQPQSPPQPVSTITVGNPTLLQENPGKEWVLKHVNRLLGSRSKGDCPICLMPMEAVGNTKLKCKHRLHTNCWTQWSKVKPICPICRKFCRV